MERRTIGSGSDWERRGGYSRAVVAGERVFVAGTAPIMPGDADPPPDPYGQAKRCLEIVEAALREAGGGLEHV
ncbi:MAG TPA: Rid family hydrolase, partial [Gaiellaceae bacterium]|nr:Rid family hydrolase [Gaiellaceae bacterium]